ncbi:unnamed protein product [Linum trigynum]|uniref:Uncharacterized protein n=1 Tax=Linum trigynum TaxID=586398 RepID=A0AAV2F378_9ROSI
MRRSFDWQEEEAGATEKRQRQGWPSLRELEAEAGTGTAEHEGSRGGGRDRDSRARGRGRDDDLERSWEGRFSPLRSRELEMEGRQSPAGMEG